MSEFFNEAKKFASEHDEMVDKGFDAAAKEADERTGNKYGNQIQQGEEKLEGFLDMHPDDNNQ